jgi:hypothetical protein
MNPADIDIHDEIRKFAIKVNDGVPNVFDPAGELIGQGVERIVEMLKKNYSERNQI